MPGLMRNSGTPLAERLLTDLRSIYGRDHVAEDGYRAATPPYLQGGQDPGEVTLWLAEGEAITETTISGLEGKGWRLVRVESEKGHPIAVFEAPEVGPDE